MWRRRSCPSCRHISALHPESWLQMSELSPPQVPGISNGHHDIKLCTPLHADTLPNAKFALTACGSKAYLRRTLSRQSPSHLPEEHGYLIGSLQERLPFPLVGSRSSRDDEPRRVSADTRNMNVSTPHYHTYTQWGMQSSP